MTIMLVGGGSGGHITPLLAIAKHLKFKNSDIRITAVTDRGGKFTSLFGGSKDIDQLKLISAGKLRRFHGESGWARISDVKRNLLNLRDIFRLLAGLLQGFWLLVRSRPQIIFIKGGYVGVPIGLCAWLLRIPYITHDSDALAGLSNRLIARGAQVHAVGMPSADYNYPLDTIILTGIPVGEGFYPVSAEEIAQTKADMDIPPNSRVLMITGGSNGAQRLNKAITGPVIELLERYSDLWVIHQFGQGNDGLYDQYSTDLRKRIQAEPFLDPLSDYSKVADVIITRAGATTLAEFAAQAKACVVVPNPLLTGGHQIQNAKTLAETGAISVLNEEELNDKPTAVTLLGNLLDNPDQRSHMGTSLEQAMPPNAAEKLADLLIQHTGVNRSTK